MKICKTEREYIDMISVPAQRACKRYGYLPSVLIAQSCFENGYGIEEYWDNPEIVKLLEANNGVGIKSKLLNNSWVPEYTVWNGESITKLTPEETKDESLIIIEDKFRKYESVEQSFADFLLFLTYASNYGKGGIPKYGYEVLAIKDPLTLISEVSRRGYASSTSYVSSVMKIINKHNLTQYDNLSGVNPTMYMPVSIKEEPTDEQIEKDMNIKKLADRPINDITKRNLNQVPRPRGSNKIEFIVIHYLGVPNADNPDLYGGGYGGHYNIERNGQIYKAADPKTAIVWHCGGSTLQGQGGHEFFGICTNYNSIGIENGVCYTENVREGDGDSNKWYFTEETQESLVWLVSKLMDEYGISSDHVIRHYNVTGKICPNPYVKNNKLKTSWTWDEFKANLAQYRRDGTITVPDRNAPVVTKDYLSKGDRGEDVKTMQTMLNACGYNCGTADGIFGDKTESALVAFRLDNKMTKTPKYTAKVKTALEAAYKTSKGESTVYQGVDYSPVYNYTYYRKKYKDLRDAYDNFKVDYFNHFCTNGMKEGRKASASFDVQKYKNRYPDLQKAFGNDLPEYYKHYCIYGKKEGRKAD